MISIFTLILFIIKYSKEKCLMYGIHNDTTNYFYNGPPKELPKNISSEFIKHCNFLLPNNYKINDKINTCCDENQLNFLIDKISMLESFAPNCKTCAENIKRISCSIVCNPDQSDYIDVTLDENNTLVSGIEFYITELYINKLYNSCKDIHFVNSIIPLLIVLCDHGPSVCNPSKLIISLMAQSLFKMTPHITNTSINKGNKIAIDPPILDCDKTYKLNNYSLIKKCVCQDCEKSCSKAPIIPKDNIILIWGIFTKYEFILIVIYYIFVVSYVVVVLSFFSRYEKDPYDVFNLVENDVQTDIINNNRDDDPLEGYDSNISYLQIRIFRRITNLFTKWGIFVASKPYIVGFITSIILIILICGIYKFEITNNAIDMWSEPNGKFRKEKEFFDKTFGPFYRTEQIIIKTPSLLPTIYSIADMNVTLGSPIKYNIIKEIFLLQERIKNLKFSYNVDNSIKNVTLDDICFKPLANISMKCGFYSITQYFQNNIKLFNKKYDEYDWKIHLLYCSNNYGSINDKNFNDASCLSDFSSPVNPSLVYGGYNNNSIEGEVLIITYIIENYYDKIKNIPAETWEKGLINFLNNYTHNDIKISFNTEISIELEIDKQTKSEIITVLISYILMFLYVSFTLGRYDKINIKNILIYQKIIVGLSGVIIIFLSVLASIGLFCYMGQKINMIIMEVLPFLILAVGIDNIFLIVHEYHRINILNNSYLTVEEIIGSVIGKIGYGIFISCIAQAITFSMGCLSNIPAVKSFSKFASLAIIINFILQMTLFLIILTFDSIREKQKRINIICCIKFNDDDNIYSSRNKMSLIEKCFKYLSLIIFNKYIKVIVIFIFFTIWFISAYHVPSLEIGLDQQIILPKNSYLSLYYKDVYNYLKTGPPVYFIIEPGFLYEDKINQYLIGSCQDCNNNSLSNIINDYSRISNYSKISTPPNSWIDTYLAWLDPLSEYKCCRYYTNNSNIFCPSNILLSDNICQSCIKHNYTSISKDQFNKYLKWFLQDIPNNNCPFGGKPAYGKAVKLNDDYNINKSAPVVYSSHFMTYHTSLSSQSQFIQAIRLARNISDILTQNIHHNVIPYSIFYIFYESYLTIWKDTLISFIISFIILLIINIMMYGFQFRISLIITFLLFLMDLTNIGLMYIFRINLNPVSLVNLIMFLGINIEFLTHIAQSYLLSSYQTRQSKAIYTFIYTGSTVFSGIFITKIIGIIVLAFSSSLLFKMYYFTMFMCSIIVGALHGLILFPILLSYFGPETQIYTNIDQQ